MLDGKSRPVYLTPDTTVFNDPDFSKQSIYYQDLLNVRGNFPNVIELQKERTSVAIIHQPTLFFIHDYFLAYPREHIIIKKAKYNDFYFLKSNGNKRRNRELSFFPTFHKIESFPIAPSLPYGMIDTILSLERNLKSVIAKSINTSKLLFDSLSKAYKVSKKFKEIAGDYLENRNYISLYSFYNQHKDTLQVHGLFRDKYKDLMSLFNGITKRSKFNGISIIFNEMANEVLPYKFRKIESNIEFSSCFDTVQCYFTGFARDYLLSQLMYVVYKKRILIDADYAHKYMVSCLDKPFKKLISNLNSQQLKNDIKTSYQNTNNLLTVDGKILSLEDIIAKQKGKLIVIDFWATWCAPCRAELPYLKKLLQEYSEDEIVFINISLDIETQPWKKDLISRNETTNHYLMVNQDKSSFMKQFGINAIPRYLILNQAGQVVDSEAPNPSDPKLKGLINKYLENTLKK